MADQTFLDWPFFQPEHKDMAIRLRDWAKKNIAHSDHSNVDEECRRLVSELAKSDWLRYCVPCSHGGHYDHLDVRSLCLIRETLAYYSGLADFSFAMQGLGSGTISLFGSPELKDAYLPAVCSGEKIAAFALSEPEAGSDVAAMSTSAEIKGDEVILSGRKTFISNGGIADYYTVFARTSQEPGAKGISAFVVDANTRGLEIEERIDVIAPHPLATLKFNNCRISKSKQLGETGHGFKMAMATLDVFRSTVGAAALGFARRALDEALSRVSTRKMFGGYLKDLQLTQSTLGEMALEIDASALLIYRAAWMKDTGTPRISKQASMAKLYATEAAQKIIDQAVQMFGGMGVVCGVTVENLYREIRALRIYEGASEVHKIIIAGQILKEMDIEN